MGKEQHHERVCDILVAGGGMAGVTCALAAARNGAKVILCQDRAVLGGNSSSEIRLPIMGADVCGKRGALLEVEAREGGILEEIRLENAYRNPQRCPEMWDFTLFEKCRTEPNLELLLNTAVTGADVADNTITKAHAVRISTEDAFHITAQIYIDCTGDGRLGIEAGAKYTEGRESRREYDESKAPETADNYRLGSSLLFMARDMGHPVRFIPPAFARKFTETDLQQRTHKNLEFGYWWIEYGGTLDTIKDNEQIRDELLAIMMGVWDHIKNGGDHGAENWALTWFGFTPGKRESRRFVGRYRLKQGDIEQAVDFPDTIAYGGWALDIHPPQGIDAPKNHPGTVVFNEYIKHLFGIPMRACVSANINNLMFAGRNISATHIAFSATRVMGTCAVIGQGVGTAGALGVVQSISPADMAGNKAFMKQLQQQLLHDDCFIPGVSNQDENDLARKAHITASSFQENGEPVNIISGETRAVHGPQGVKRGLTRLGTHRWMSKPVEGFPAWIQLEWPRPVELSRVQLIFDTGLYRALTLSHYSNFYNAEMYWSPQPETVKAYHIEYAADDGKMIRLASEPENYQRRRVHCFERLKITRLRLIVKSTWGLNHARVIEVRCYEK
ncbi:MAG: FAD-dependent oxidoreductase [Sedimentisphaerales bacterium]|nr:FAD-dependent oxidoreductase [Sedimentisphaerales bacterium]